MKSNRKISKNMISNNIDDKQFVYSKRDYRLLFPCSILIVGIFFSTYVLIIMAFFPNQLIKNLDFYIVVIIFYYGRFL